MSEALKQLFSSSRNIPMTHSQFFKEKKGIDFEYFNLSFQQRFSCFLGSLFLGIFLFVYSFLNIVNAFFNPAKFAIPYAISNFLFFSMFGFIFGFKTYFKNLFSKSKRVYTSLFLFSTFWTIYSCLRFGSYVMNFFFAILQIISFVAFCITFVPGGSKGISSMVSMITRR